jgi:hypothetical protein
MSWKKLAIQTTNILLLCSSGKAQQLPVFFDNFDGGRAVAPPISGGFSGYTNIEPAQGFNGLGNAGNRVSGNFLHNSTGDTYTNTPSQMTTLSLAGLPAHTGIQLKFVLAIIDTWDGSLGDFFHVDIDGVSSFAETFTSFDFFTQSYIPAPRVLIQRGSDLGFEIFADSLYDMGLDVARFGSIPHVSSDLRIDFYAGGPNWNRPANESWAIDNITVVLLGVPEPESMSLLGMAPLGIGGLIGRRRHVSI